MSLRIKAYEAGASSVGSVSTEVRGTSVIRGTLLTYNLGGGRENSASVLESIAAVEAITGTKLRRSFVEQNRRGDHICYISDLRQLTAHYPE